MNLKATVLGAGFYGCILALRLAEAGWRVTLCERQDDILGRASYANQARVHGGYHYPRSLLTALRARANLPRFASEFADCIDHSFDKYYAIAAQHSHVTVRHFAAFCRRIDAPLQIAPVGIRRLFDPRHVEAVFTVEEHAFDAVKLRHATRARLAESTVDVRLNLEVRRVRRGRSGGLQVEVSGPAGERAWHADRVFNCTYSGINEVLSASGVRPVGLKHEIAEIALVEVPAEMASIGVTVMCGPFFSCMPFPSRGLHSLSHVRYTPRATWNEGEGLPVRDGGQILADVRQRTCFSRMVRDAARYLPVIAESRHIDSLWEVKTVPVASERDDGRPILLDDHRDMPGLTSILGSKIDTVFDMLDALHVPQTAQQRRAA